jgi:outer membrane immunogenic protein
MKLLLLSSLIGLALVTTSSVFAADLTAPSPPPMYIKAAPSVPVAGWAGLYVGFNAGWVGSTGNNIIDTGADTDGGGLGSALSAGSIPAAINLGYNGFLGGGQFGYNWQSGNVVYGLEADFDATSAKSSVTLPDARFIPVLGLESPFTINATRQLDWIGTLRGRLGFTPSAPLLLYATGGLAFGEQDLGIGINDPTAIPAAVLFNQTSTWSTGWTLGAGGEWMFAPRWSLKVEYLYVHLGNVSSTINYAYTPVRTLETSSLTATVHDRDSIVRGGINYHF